jgi:hypothetical protein
VRCKKVLRGRGILRLVAIACSLVSEERVRAAVDTSILPPDRATVWNPGLMAVGGIPARDTIYRTLTPGGSDDSAAIQSALDTCPAGQVVLLSAGTFTVNNYLLIHSPITLRGSGPAETILRKANGARPRTDPMHPVDPSTYTYDAAPVVIVGPSRWPKVDSTSQTLMTDGVKGATSVTVSNAAGFSVGGFVLLDERSGAFWQATPAGFPGNAKVWKGDKVAWNMHLPQQQWQDDNTYSDASGPYDSAPGTPPDAMSWFSRTDRPTCEIKEIASISGNAVTFTTPLHTDYRRSHTAQLTGYTGANALVKNAGVESLTAIGGADGQIRFENAAYSWARNVESTQWIGEGFAVNGSFRVEIRESWVHDASWPEPGGAGYAISFAGGSSDVLVENNIILNACKVVVVRSCGAGSVFGYNDTDDSWDFDNPAWVEVGLNASHMAGPHHVLFEGNYSQNLDSDYTHGNAVDLTFFRNWLSGQRRSFTDTSNVRTVGLAYGSWWDSVIGNVLGRPGQMSGWLYEDPAMTGNNSNWGGSAVWRLGYDPERWSMVPDPAVLLTVIRDGNFDYLTNSVHWHNTPAGYALPSSLYLSGKPAFFGSYTWPWVDATGSTKFFTLPAKARYDAGTPFAPPPGGPPPPPPVFAATTFNTLAPCRLIDTRNGTGPLSGPPIGAGELRSFVATGTCGVPAGAVTLSANVTAVNPAAAGDLVVYPNGVPSPPSASTLSLRAGRTRANNSLVSLASDGSFLVKNNAAGGLDFVLDVNGYFK